MPHIGMNKVILIGTVDTTPRLHQTAERARLTLRLHTMETYRDEGGVERTRRAWHEVVVWGRRAEALAPILARGRRVAIEGRLVNDSWEGADGKRRYRTEVHAYEIVLLDSRGEGSTSALVPPTERDAA
ncbi:MAG TPA: single-stranded DNA-binding protein [Sandaracinaceae bacterium]